MKTSLEDQSSEYDAPDFWVYILQCTNNSFYTGYTLNLIQRYHAHLQGTAAKYTRSFPPVSLAGCWPIYGSKGQALKIERYIKQANKNDKLLLINDPSILEQRVIEADIT